MKTLLRHGRENSLLRSGGCQKTSRWALDSRFKCGTCCSRRGTSCRSCCCGCRSCQSHCRCISIRFQMLENTSEKQKSQLSNEIKNSFESENVKTSLEEVFFPNKKIGQPSLRPVLLQRPPEVHPTRGHACEARSGRCKDYSTKVAKLN